MINTTNPNICHILSILLSVGIKLTITLFHKYLANNIINAKYITNVITAVNKSISTTDAFGLTIFVTNVSNTIIYIIIEKYYY